MRENETVPDAKVVLYNLGEDTSRGARVRAILAELNIPAETVTAEQLNETVGHLAGLDGYEAAGEKYTGTVPDTEFMLLCNLPEALLDMGQLLVQRFKDAHIPGQRLVQVPGCHAPHPAKHRRVRRGRPAARSAARSAARPAAGRTRARAAADRPP